MNDADEISYRPRQRAEGVVIGAHRGRGTGGQGVFIDHAPYLLQPDPRRIDLRLTARDPFETVYVRRYQQRLAIALYAIVDLSGSMRFEGAARKFALISALCTCLARSAHRLGDAFGLIGCDDRLRDDFFIPATRRSGVEAEVARRFESFVPHRPSAAGLLEAATYLGSTRKLVFLISDFRFPLADVEQVLQALSRHDVVPVVAGDSAEEAGLPGWGIIDMQDLETGRQKVVFMRPALRRRWLAQAEVRRRSLARLFRRYGRPPFDLTDRFAADDLSRHLLET